MTDSTHFTGTLSVSIWTSHDCVLTIRGGAKLPQKLEERYHKMCNNNDDGGGGGGDNHTDCNDVDDDEDDDGVGVGSDGDGDGDNEDNDDDGDDWWLISGIVKATE